MPYSSQRGWVLNLPSRTSPVGRMAVRGGEAGAAALPDPPAGVANLVLWFDASYAPSLWKDAGRSVPVTVDGEQVYTWDTIAGPTPTRHAVQATATARPLYKTAIQNGKPGVLGDGIDDLMLIPTGPWFPLKRGTLFFVWRRVGALTGRAITGTHANTAPVWQTSYIPTPERHAWYDGVASAIVETVAFDNLTHLHTYNRAADTTMAFRRNGVAKLTPAITNNQPANNACGLLSSATTNWANAYLFEYLYYDRSLTGAEVTSLESYLNAKWAVY